MSDISIRVYAFVQSALAGLRDREEGQDLIEYALLGGLIAAAIMAGFVLFGDSVKAMVGEIGECIDFDGATKCNPGP